MARKRAKGEGTIRKRADGLWEARLSVPGGNPKSFYGKTQAEAVEKRAEAKRTLEDGYSLDSGKQSVGEYLERWLEGPLSSSVSPKTYEDYTYLCRKHAIPEIGWIKHSALTAENLDQLYARKLASGLSPRTVGYLHSTLRVALQRAVKKRLVPYNVARDAEPPAQRQREIKTLSREELATFFEAAKGDRYEAFFVMGALSGLRPGEMLALRWEDLRLPDASGDPGVARIRRSLSKLPSGMLLIRETTKTGRGRAVHLLPEVVAALKAHRRRQLEERMAKGT